MNGGKNKVVGGRKGKISAYEYGRKRRLYKHIFCVNVCEIFAEQAYWRALSVMVFKMVVYARNAVQCRWHMRDFAVRVYVLSVEPICGGF